MEAVRATEWTDNRLDDLNGTVDRIDRRVDALGRRMDERFDEQRRDINARFDAQQRDMNSRFDAQQRDMNARFDSLQRAMFQAAMGLAIAFLTGSAAIVATQL